MIGRRDIYVRADLRPIYGDKKRHRISARAVVAIVAIVLVIGGLIYALLGAKTLGRMNKPKGSIESSVTAVGTKANKK